jgi:hypothetical protein
MSAFHPEETLRKQLSYRTLIVLRLRMPALRPCGLESDDLDKVTRATALKVKFPRSGEAEPSPTNATFVTLAGFGFEAPPLPC